ncbi:MAG TPA: AAA family ATPase [Candidatus Avipropionibacterium avicola]|uniref:AAA family ATPase n=1 Tax=Candidatus Avipropionibacterium avicola TaxID=2840701 RepID=A0A9D1H0L7_9ACTN|nr:AAA family ATPase [Candidatus Avipropionibacterium avicola]
MVAEQIAEEQAHVDKVYRRLIDLTRTAQGVAADGQSLHQSDRLSFVREEDGTSLFERDAFSYQAAKRLATLESEHDGLVFGRLDHRDGETRYIGRMGVRDDQYEPLVVDWRARAAEPFYRATPADPMQVVRRRVLRCRGERVIGVEDDLLDGEAADEQLVVVGEGALLAALTRSRGPRMRDIVATIQSEQDEAIRAPYQGVTMITGGPGTGKTVVALHRAAYLLYSHRRRFENGGVLVVGPSSVFMNYIERVLPSLGEDSVTLRSVGRVADDVIPLGPERHDAAAAAIAKGGLRMTKVLRRLTRDPQVVAPADDLRIMVKGEAVRISADRLDAIRTEVLRRHKINEGRNAAFELVLRALRSRWDAVSAMSAQDAPTDGDDDEMTDDLFTDLVTSTATWRMFAQSWWPVLESRQVLARLGDREVVARVGDGLLSSEEQQALVDSYAQPGWSVADAALLDELVALIGNAPPEEDEPETSLFLDDEGSGVQELVSIADRLTRVVEPDPFDEPHRTYAHVLVDEAQDITPMQWRMLRRRGSRASWTIVGDPAQSSWPDVAENTRAIEDLIGNAPQRHFRMSTNYRSPAEVYDLAGAVITRAYGPADVPDAVRSTGVAPDLRIAADPVAIVPDAVADLSQQVEGTIGVVTAAAQHEATTAAVAGLSDAGLRDRVAVVTAQQSKGLEYDAVVVLEPDRIVAESPAGVRLLYVALTRPTQRLVTVDATPDAAWRP